MGSRIPGARNARTQRQVDYVFRSQQLTVVRVGERISETEKETRIVTACRWTPSVFSCPNNSWLAARQTAFFWTWRENIASPRTSDVAHIHHPSLACPFSEETLRAETGSAPRTFIRSLSDIFPRQRGFRDRCTRLVGEADEPAAALVKLANVRGNLIEFKLGLVINNDIQLWWRRNIVQECFSCQHVRHGS